MNSFRFFGKANPRDLNNPLNDFFCLVHTNLLKQPRQETFSNLSLNVVWIQRVFCHGSVHNRINHQGLIHIAFVLFGSERGKSRVAQHDAKYAVVGAGMRIIAQCIGCLRNVALFELFFEIFEQHILLEGMLKHRLCFTNSFS